MLATMAIESTNLASKNSNVRMSVNLVKSEEIDYVEKDFPSDLAMLRASAWVKAEREAAKAQVVFLLTTVSDYCGLSDVILADKSNAFAVINYICAVGNFSLAHEFGHLLGLRHERAADTRRQTVSQWTRLRLQKRVADDHGNSQSLHLLSSNSFLVKSVNQIQWRACWYQGL